jgi:hypothetical protein
MTDRLERTWNKVTMAYLRYCPSICQDGMRKTTESLNQDSWCPGQDLNQSFPKYKIRALPLGQPIHY